MKTVARVTKSLDEAIKYEKGEQVCRTNKLTVKPVPEYDCNAIKELRGSLEMTQLSFALLLGVSKKTVIAWEAGVRKPNGSARRLLGLLDQDRNIPKKYHIVE